MYACTHMCTHIHTMEYYSALKKTMKTCHFQQHGWTWRILC